MRLFAKSLLPIVMLDIKYIRDNADAIQTAAKNKQIDIDISHLLSLDEKRRSLLQHIEDLKAQKNAINKEIVAANPEEKKNILQRANTIKERTEILENEFTEIKEEFDKLMVRVPTIPSPDTPIGSSSEDNVEIERWGKLPVFDFEPKDHVQLGKDLGILDLERGVKVSGFRGYYVKGDGVLLMMGFIMYALQKLAAKGYNLMIPPTIAKEFVLFGSGYFKGDSYDEDADEIYALNSGEKDSSGKRQQKFLIGTAEPSLLAYYADELLKEEDLPIRFTGFSQCYRSEIGSYSKDLKGIYRVHEFMKVEQVVLCRADIEESEQILNELVENAKELHQDLELPYRMLRICTGDLAPGKYKSYDIEAWMPGKGAYGETGTASNFVDWQARRLNVRYTTKEGKNIPVFMLNNTALPTPRIFISILENYQQKDGSVRVPDVLVPFVGKKIITKAS